MIFDFYYTPPSTYPAVRSVPISVIILQESARSQTFTYLLHIPLWHSFQVRLHGYSDACAKRVKEFQSREKRVMFKGGENFQRGKTYGKQMKVHLLHFCKQQNYLRKYSLKKKRFIVRKNSLRSVVEIHLFFSAVIMFYRAQIIYWVLFLPPISISLHFVTFYTTYKQRTTLEAVH